MDVFAISLLLKAQGAATVEAALAKLRASAKGAEKDVSALDNALSSVGGEMRGLLGGLGVVAVLGKIITETRDAGFETAQLNAALKSTRGVAGMSAEALNEHALALSRISVFDDGVVTQAQALLLTFTQIRGPIFKDATQAILNVAQAMGTDLRSATIQVGKALNDPVLGMTALARSGIQFTEAQKDTIKTLVETNRVVEAQRIILAELETQFGGSAAAARDTFGGALAGLVNEINNLATVSDEGAGGAARAINNLSLAIRGLNNVLSETPGLIARMNNGFMRLPEWAQDFLRGTASRLAPTAFFPLALLMKQGAAAAEELGAAAKDAAVAVKDVLNPQTPTVDTTDWAQRAKDFDAWMATYREGQRQMARDAVAARNIANVTRTDRMVPAPITAIGAGAASAMRASVRQSMAVTRDIVDDSLATEMQEVRDTFSRGFAEALGAGLANGFQVALSTKSIGQGFKALTGTILQSFGSLLVQFGTKALVASEAIQRMFAFLFTPGPKAAIAAAAIIAIGAGLQAAGQGILSNVSRGGGGSFVNTVGGGMSGGGMVGGMGVITYNPTMAGNAAANVTARAPMTFNIIGPNDPAAQRQLQELIRNADRRGNIMSV